MPNKVDIKIVTVLRIVQIKMDGPEKINVRVKTLDGQEHIIEAERTAQISAFKLLIESKIGIPPSV